MSSDIHADRPVHEGEDLSADEFGDHQHGATDRQYIVIALILALITAAEVTLSYIDVGPIFLPALLIMMAAKFIIVVSFFMHLKFDHRIFSFLFYTGLLLAVGVYVAALGTFHFFGS
jgi:cytochrome c oxidase subunit IV